MVLFWTLCNQEEKDKGHRDTRKLEKGGMSCVMTAVWFHEHTYLSMLMQFCALSGSSLFYAKFTSLKLLKIERRKINLEKNMPVFVTILKLALHTVCPACGRCSINKEIIQLSQIIHTFNRYIKNVYLT